MHSNRELKEMKKLKRVRALVRELLLDEGSAATATAERALKYNLVENERVLMRIKPLVNCPSGILLNIPTSVPGRVISWMSLLRYYEVYDPVNDAYYLFVCLDDVGYVATMFLSPFMPMRGAVGKRRVANIVRAFSIVLARIARTKKRVEFTKRVELAVKLEKAILDVLNNWAEECKEVIEE
ncbi:MAG: hypothetical protein QW496_03350 [Desulfurococcaceae archaeon]